MEKIHEKIWISSEFVKYFKDLNINKRNEENCMKWEIENLLDNLKEDWT